MKDNFFEKFSLTAPPPFPVLSVRVLIYFLQSTFKSDNFSI